MNLLTLVLDVLLTIPLSFILIKLERKRESFLYSCLLPTIYIIIIAALIPILKKNIYLIPIFEIFIRNFYITNINEELNNNKEVILQTILSLLLVFFVYNYFISKVTNVLPTPDEIRPILWLLIIFTIYSIFKDTDIKNKSSIKSIVGKKEYILMQYAKYRARYDDVIKSRNKTINKIIYSIMIFKTYQQPPVLNGIKNYFNHLLNKEVRYGILEVSSPVPVSDEESIIMILKEMESISRKIKDKNSISNYLEKYNIEEQKEMEYIYSIIDNF